MSTPELDHLVREAALDRVLQAANLTRTEYDARVNGNTGWLIREIEAIAAACNANPVALITAGINDINHKEPR